MKTVDPYEHPVKAKPGVFIEKVPPLRVVYGICGGCGAQSALTYTLRWCEPLGKDPYRDFPRVRVADACCEDCANAKAAAVVAAGECVA